ncbi:hypothetical protein PoB_006059100 [Plakobranchus ocellatus]|uniref:Uncharacterized protein n=1 Tax=Plakobranchus ocellatus TaxID=259542 RepID=A0AAV4CQF4_9GAST|nr:hypothetical protein PoB_006059100 [Plakobranchus ocellatus]
MITQAHKELTWKRNRDPSTQKASVRKRLPLQGQQAHQDLGDAKHAQSSKPRTDEMASQPGTGTEVTHLEADPHLYSKLAWQLCNTCLESSRQASKDLGDKSKKRWEMPIASQNRWAWNQNTGKHSGGMAYGRQGQNWHNPYQSRPARGGRGSNNNSNGETHSAGEIG